MTNPDPREQELARLRSQVRALESQIAESTAGELWRPRVFYTAYYANSGALLGLLAAMVSLMLNVICAPIAGRNPLELIRIYLTFPLGERALQLLTPGQRSGYVLDDGLIIAFGCCLYLFTGLVLGVPLFVAQAYLTENKSLGVRLAVATGLGLVLWVVMFYGVLVWLQPALFEGNWITDPKILPPWVAAATHLVFAWTLAIAQPLGTYQPYQRPQEA
jgi:hypothetical protein